jgi:hypothetical protein
MKIVKLPGWAGFYFVRENPNGLGALYPWRLGLGWFEVRRVLPIAGWP